MRRTTAAAAIVAALIVCLLVGVCAWSVVHDGLPGTSTPAEGEDCDAEDLRNRETDCGFAPGAGKPTTTKATRKATPTRKR